MAYSPSASESIVLEVRDAEKRFGGVQALRGVTLDAAASQVTGLIGPNGSGKSTLFNVITGVVEMDAGVVYLDGKLLDKSRPDRVAEQGLIRTFQIPRVATRMTVLENLMLAPKGQSAENLGSLFSLRRRGLIRREREALLDRCWEMLVTLGLTDVANDYAGTLSGGQLKLLSVGVALMADPRILLLDEPTAGVNPVLTDRIKVLLADLRERGLAILVIEHNIEVIAELCERVHVMDAGALIASGPPEEIQRDRQVIEAYLGVREAR